MKTARVLAIDGGGIRGVIPAAVVASLEKALGPIASRFHLIAGTSTGGIVAAGLARTKPVPAADLIKFYRDRGPAIFSSSYSALGGLEGPKYPAAPLEQALGDVFGDTRLASIGASGADFMATAYALGDPATGGRAPWLVKSWRARGLDGGTDDDDFRLADVCRATSAAPTFFPPARITSGAGKAYALIDGGVCMNNPAMAAYAAARRLYPLADEILVVSIGTGDATKPIPFEDAEAWGFAGWAQPLLDILMQGVSETTAYELNQLAPSVRHIRLQTSLAGANEALDDASPGNLDALAACAARMITAKKATMDAVIASLREPLADRAVLGYPKAGARPIPAKAPPGKPIVPAASPTAAMVTAAVAAPAATPRETAFVLGGGAIGAIVGAIALGPVGLVVGGLGGLFAGTKVSQPAASPPTTAA